MQKISLKLNAAIKLANDVREFNFEAPADIDLNFEPGQFFIVDVEDGKQPPVTRSYSVASRPDGKNVDFCVKIIPDGRGSTYLENLKPGDETKWQGPFGHFVLGKTNNDVIFVATGVGLAPFVGILEEMFANGFDKQITLYFGVRHESDLFYQEKLATWAEEHNNFKVITTLSRPEEGWSGESGRVTEHLESAKISPETDVFICGNGNMVQDVKSMMEEKGLPKEKIHFELFTPISKKS